MLHYKYQRLPDYMFLSVSVCLYDSRYSRCPLEAQIMLLPSQSLPSEFSAHAYKADPKGACNILRQSSLHTHTHILKSVQYRNSRADIS